MSAELLQEVRGLHAQYGATEALHGLDFGVRSGGITTLLGANGAGKTTTLRTVCGMVKAQGEVRLRSIGPAELELRDGPFHLPSPTARTARCSRPRASRLVA